jgi:hypothetical protein
MCAGGADGIADEIAEYSQETADKIKIFAGGADEIAEHSQEIVDTINVCRWC